MATAFLFGRYCLVPDQRALFRDGQVISIRSRTFDLLLVLIERRERIVSKEELIGLVWPGRVVDVGNLTVHVASLRKLLDKGVIATLSGRGYRFVASVEERPYEGAMNVGGAQPPEATSPPKESERKAGNFPFRSVDIVGRASDLRSLLGLVADSRIVTLTGPAGIGKTTLSLEVCRALASDFNDGVWFVDLSSLSDAALVPSTAAGKLGLNLGDLIMSADMVAHGIAEQNLLLVLDNCEHVIEAAAELAEAIVSQCPRTTVLATSRETLRVAGEGVYRLSPLELPASDDEKLESLLQRSAVELLLSKTKALNAGIEPDDSSRAAIVAICRRLDGIPLALEFAAASVATLGFSEVASRLDDRFRFLTRGRRTALPRHQTLRATLDWGYDLLPEAEKRLLRHLGIFAGGFTVAAAATVASGDEQEVAVRDDLAALTAKSFVVFDGSVRGGRWRLLETIRAYALEKLRQGGEVELAARRHAEHFRDHFASFVLESRSQFDAEILSAHAREIDNVRAALDWAFSSGVDTATALVLTAAYGPVWLHLSLIAECRDYAERAMQHLGQCPDMRTRLYLHILLGLTLVATGSVDRAWAALSEALDISDELDDPDMQLRALWAMWSHRCGRGEGRAARDLAERFSEVARRSGTFADLLVGDRLMGTTIHYEGDQPEAQRHLERFLDLYKPQDDRRQAMWLGVDQRLHGRSYLARVLLLQGLLDQARRMAQAAFEDAQAIGHPISISFYLGEVAGPIAMMTGDLEAGARAAGQLMEISTRQGLTYWKDYGQCLQGALLIKRGAGARGTLLLRNALEAFRGTETAVAYLPFLCDLVEGSMEIGEMTEARAMCDEGIAEAKRGGQHWYLAEFLRRKGEILLREGQSHSDASAETCFLDSVEIARHQGALLWELRAAMSLARLRQRQKRSKLARQVLAPVFDRFTEGFDTADLRLARAVLDYDDL